MSDAGGIEMEYKISIVVPIYNVEKELDRCVQSIMHQTYFNIEIILVDDGSPDKCPAMCDEYAKQDMRVVVIHKSNGGLSDARNAGLKKATGEYVLFVDSDDYIEIDACERLVAGMKEKVDFVAGAYKVKNNNKEFIKRHSNIQEKVIYTSREFVIQSIKNNEWYAPAVLNLYRRSFLIENQLFYKVGYLFEDVEMLPRIFLAAQKMVYIDYPFYNYIIRNGSIITSGNIDYKREMANKIYNEWMDEISQVDDEEYKRYLYGILVRYYLHSCRVFDGNGWNIKNMDFRFAVKYALNFSEFLKVILFSTMPKVYNNVLKRKS